MRSVLSVAEVHAAPSAHLNRPLMELGACLRCDDFAHAAEDVSPSDDFVAASVEHKCCGFARGEVLALARGNPAGSAALGWRGCVDRGSFPANLILEAAIRASCGPKGRSCDAFRLPCADVALDVQGRARDRDGSRSASAVALKIRTLPSAYLGHAVREYRSVLGREPSAKLHHDVPPVAHFVSVAVEPECGGPGAGPPFPLRTGGWRRSRPGSLRPHGRHLATTVRETWFRVSVPVARYRGEVGPGSLPAGATWLAGIGRHRHSGVRSVRLRPRCESSKCRGKLIPSSTWSPMRRSVTLPRTRLRLSVSMFTSSTRTRYPGDRDRLRSRDHDRGDSTGGSRGPHSDLNRRAFTGECSGGVRRERRPYGLRRRAIPDHSVSRDYLSAGTQGASGVPPQ